MSFAPNRRFYRPGRPGRSTQSWRQRQPRSNLDYNRVKAIILTVFFSATLIWFAYFFFASRHWAIGIVNITGLSSIPRVDFEPVVVAGLRARRWLFFRQNNILLLSKADLRAKIAEKYILEALDIDKDFPYTLNLAVKEKTARLILRSLRPIAVLAALDAAATGTPPVAGESLAAPEYFYLDVNGIVMARPGALSAAALAAYPVVEIIDAGQSSVKPGDVALNREVVEYIFALYDGLKGSPASLTVTHVSYDPKIGDELKFVTSEGWQGIISKKLELEAQIKKLEVALQEKIKEQRPSLQYVDLRVKDRVYYK